MIKKFVSFLVTLLQSGILFHRSTYLGMLCAAWVYFGAPKDESLIQRMLTLDLYLFMFAFLVMYRVLFLKIYTPDGDLDLKTMGIYLLGDMAWAIAAMICTVPVFLIFGAADTYSSAQNNPQVKQLMQYKGLRLK